MSILLIGFVALIYLGVAVSEYAAGRHGMAFTWFAYSLANAGMIWNIREHG